MGWLGFHHYPTYRSTGRFVAGSRIKPVEFGYSSVPRRLLLRGPGSGWWDWWPSDNRAYLLDLAGADRRDNGAALGHRISPLVRDRISVAAVIGSNLAMTVADNNAEWSREP
jgi:hypothetical protein